MSLRERRFEFVRQGEGLGIQGYRAIKPYDGFYLAEDLNVFIKEFQNRFEKIAEEVVKTEKKSEYVDAYNALLIYLRKVIREEFGQYL